MTEQTAIKPKIRRKLRIGRLVLFSVRADTGRWERKGAPMPWVSVQRFNEDGTRLRSLLVGPWCLSVMWMQD